MVLVVGRSLTGAGGVVGAALLGRAAIHNRLELTDGRFLGRRLVRVARQALALLVRAGRFLSKMLHHYAARLALVRPVNLSQRNCGRLRVSRLVNCRALGTHHHDVLDDFFGGLRLTAVGRRTLRPPFAASGAGGLARGGRRAAAVVLDLNGGLRGGIYYYVVRVVFMDREWLIGGHHTIFESDAFRFLRVAAFIKNRVLLLDQREHV